MVILFFWIMAVLSFPAFLCGVLLISFSSEFCINLNLILNLLKEIIISSFIEFEQLFLK